MLKTLNPAKIREWFEEKRTMLNKKLKTLKHKKPISTKPANTVTKLSHSRKTLKCRKNICKKYLSWVNDNIRTQIQMFQNEIIKTKKQLKLEKNTKKIKELQTILESYKKLKFNLETSITSNEDNKKRVMDCEKVFCNPKCDDKMTDETATYTDNFYDGLDKSIVSKLKKNDAISGCMMAQHYTNFYDKKL